MELLLIAEQIEYIEGKTLQFKRNEDKVELWKDIGAYMKSKYNCKDEICWVETLKLQEIEKIQTDLSLRHSSRRLMNLNMVYDFSKLNLEAKLRWCEKNIQTLNEL